MEHNSIMLVIQSIFKTIIMIVLVVEGLGVAGAVTGYTVGYAIAGATGILLMYTIYRKLPKPDEGKLEIRANMKTNAHICNTFIALHNNRWVPRTILRLPTANILRQQQHNNRKLRNSFNVCCPHFNFFASLITTMLFPAFSKLDPEKDKDTLKNVFQFSMKYAALLVVPLAMLVMCSRKPAISTLFGSSYTSAPLFLSTSAVTYVYTAFGNLTTGNFILKSRKNHLKPLPNDDHCGNRSSHRLCADNAFRCVGLIITSLTTGIPGLIVILYWINKHYGLTVDWKFQQKS